MAEIHIRQICNSLQDEIEFLKSGKGGNSIKIHDGRFLRQSNGLSLYQFQLENFLAVLEDTPAEIRVGSQLFRCDIVAVEGVRITIGIEGDLDEVIPEAVLVTKGWYLLERLKKKLTEASSPNETFANSERILLGLTSAVAHSISVPTYTDSGVHPPDSSQYAAIEQAYGQSLSLIWGPPGTGKTRTISLLVESLLKDSKRVLLVSNSNTAVDEALEKVANHFQESENDSYANGELVRVGVTRLESLTRSCPMVILDNIVTEKSREYTVELLALKKRLKSNEAQRERLRQYLEETSLLSSLSKAVNELQYSSQKLNSSNEDLELKIEGIRERLVEYRDELKLSQEYSFWGRLFNGVRRPVQIASDISRLVKEESECSSTRTKGVSQLTVINRALDERRSALSAQASVLNRLTSEFGISSEKVADQIAQSEIELRQLQEGVSHFESLISALRGNILNHARLIATTITQTFTSKELPTTPFEWLIIDESSMVSLAQLFWVCSKSTGPVTIVGDFYQLPPILTSDKVETREWLGRNIYDKLNINTLENAENVLVSMLQTQYRMHPDISSIARTCMYGHKLKDGKETTKHTHFDNVSGENRIVLVDTSHAFPWCSRPSNGGRFNIYSAHVTATLAKLTGSSGNIGVAAMSPYRAQVRLIQKMILDQSELRAHRTETIHTFQGGETDVCILDLVEGPGVTRWSMLDSASKGREADILLNVALTRARNKLYLVCHLDFLLSTISHESNLARVLRHFQSHGVLVDSRELVPGFFETEFEKWASIMSRPIVPETASQIHFTHRDFWPSFLSDLSSACEYLTIASPFITMTRTSKLMELLRTMTSKGVTVSVLCKGASRQPNPEEADVILKQLAAINVNVVQRDTVHQKVAIIDRRITWCGSLNILSHNRSEEQMTRFEGAKTAEQLIKDLELPLRPVSSKDNAMICPECAKKGIGSRLVSKKGKYGLFLSCSNFPSCRYSQDIRGNNGQWRRNQR